MTSMAVAYNPSDPLQASFLSALALGETGNSSFAATEGVGGTNLAGAETSSNGFFNWSGQGNSHAEGIFQFQPGTWNSIASKFGLNFQNPSDQAEGAWYYAQQVDPNLETQLQSGDYGAVQSALKSVWPSVTGNAAAPKGLANDIASGTGVDLSGLLGGSGANGGSGGTGDSAGGSSSGGSGGIISDIENWFLRGGLILIGGLVALVALWMLLSNNGVVPGPEKVAKGLATAV